MLLLRLAPLILLIVIHWTKSSPPARYEKFEDCSTSGKSLKIHRCEVTKDHKMFINVTLFKPVDDLIADAALMRKVGNSYRPVFPIPKIKWCELLKNNAVKPIPLLKMLIATLKPYLPTLLDGCPYSGNFVIPGITTPSTINAWMPTGNYKFSYVLYNKEDSKIISASMIMVKGN